MFQVFFCIRDQHDLRFVFLAALICIISCSTAVMMLRQGNAASEETKHRWLITGGLATGFGIWSTHFIAMLGYDPGVVAGYKPGLTAVSLAIVLATTLIGFRLAVFGGKAGSMAFGGCVAGGGFAAMHYTGMAALSLPAKIEWNPAYLLVSVALAILPMVQVLRLALTKRGLANAVMAAGLMVLGIVGLHFTGMTAIRLVPARMEDGAVLLSPSTMSALIGAVSLFLLGLCLFGGLIAKRTNAAILHSQQQFSILVRGISDCAIYMLKQDGCIANWNAGAQRLKGYSEEEVVGQPLAIFYTSEDRALGLHAQAIECARQHGKFIGEGWRVRRDGSRFWAHVTIEHVLDAEGRSLGFAKITRDMTQFKEDQDRLEEARHQLATALSNMHQGLCLFDSNARLVLRNQRFLELWNLPESSCLPGASLDEVAYAALSSRAGEKVSEERIANVHVLLKQSLDANGSEPVVVEYGEAFSMSITSRGMPDGGWVTTFEDISERRRSEKRIAHLAHHDMLTGMPNRSSFNRWLSHELVAAPCRGEQVALVAIDLDRFKEINDTHGHAIGDQVLRSFADAISNCLDENEIAARLGGDEFALAKRFARETELTDFLSRLETAIDGCVTNSVAALNGASIGVVLYPGDAEDLDTLLNNADLAMYRAKVTLGQSVCFYEAGMDEKARWRRQIASDLRFAVERNEMHLLYQEQRSVLDQTLTGYEALLRWTHPLHGNIGPDDFIPIAEESGEIVRIGEWVLRTACLEAMHWPSDLKVAVNLSPVQLLKPDLPEVVTQILLDTGLPPRRLELEITETAIITEKVRALHSLRRIKALGVSVAMDDFGTGYSSLDTLHSFPFDKIKIDKSFLLQSETNDQSRAIVKAVLALGRTLSIPVLAEGVETKMQLALLVEEGCNEAQGYLFGRPASAPSLQQGSDTASSRRAKSAAKR
ncbi:bifunctional diguanylate cyclase/phosphodiesterase [Novosphingobium olei]|uniref:bifunctional diguanylate cyclase/phosphodiesterase n=1 Tax=Novosphingobium olei TaxID=2728851 RepID=UPI003091EBAD|nr:EAL domain-containing protein [Novosphingobium olei]